MKTFKMYLLTSGYNGLLGKHLHSFGLSDEGERLLLGTKNRDLISAFLDDYSLLNESSQFALVKFDSSLAYACAKKGYYLGSDAISYLLDHKEDHDILLEYIEHRNFQELGVYPSLEIKMVDAGNKWLIRMYIIKHGLFAEAQMALVKSENKDLVDLFIGSYVPCVGACEKIVELKDKALIRKVFEKTAFHEYGRYPAAEIKLVELGDVDLFHDYIEKYDLFDETVEALLVPGQELMLLHYLSKHRLRKYEWKVTVSKKQDPMLLRLVFQKEPLHHPGYYPDAEINLIKLGNVGLIYEYIDKWEMFEEAAETLLMLKDFNLSKSYITKHHLYGVAVLELADQNNAELLRWYGQKQIYPPVENLTAKELILKSHIDSVYNDKLFANDVKKLLNTQNKELWDAYITYSFAGSFRSFELEFLKQADKELRLKYINSQMVSAEAQMWFFSLGDLDYVRALVARKILWGEVFVKLLELQEPELLKSYVSYYPLRTQGSFAKAEVMLMEHKDQELLKFYIEKHGLFDESLVELFKLKKKALLKVLVSNHKLSHIGHEQLLASKMTGLIDIYLDKFEIDRYFQGEFVKLRNLKLIQKFSNKYRFGPQGFHELVIQGYLDILQQQVAKYGWPEEYSYKFFGEVEVKFVALGDFELIKKYTSLHNLSKNGEDQLAALGNMEFVKYYLSHKH